MTQNCLVLYVDPHSYVYEGDVVLEVGRRNGATLRRLLARLPLAERYCTDPYPVYRALLPAEWHQIGKGTETNRKESPHGVLRRKLNRLARRTQGYSKSLAMLVDSLALAWLKRGWIHHTGPCQEYRIFGVCLHHIRSS